MDVKYILKEVERGRDSVEHCVRKTTRVPKSTATASSFPTVSLPVSCTTSLLIPMWPDVRYHA